MDNKDISSIKSILTGWKYFNRLGVGFNKYEVIHITYIVIIDQDFKNKWKLLRGKRVGETY